jgi:CheY-like chemotaxis protein
MSKGKKRILIVDDEEIYLLLVKRLLTPLGLDTLWSKSRAEAFEQIDKKRPDLIILDLRLSERSDDKSGLELLKEFRRSWPTIQVIVFTSYYLDAEMIVECMKSGAYYYFIKAQFESVPQRFVDLVTEALEYKPRQDVIEDTYPHPLALLYRDYRRNVVVPQSKFRRLIEVAELLVKLSAIVCLSASKGDYRPPGGRAATNSLLKPTLGSWFEFLRYAIGQPAPSGVWIDSIRQIFTPVQRSTVDSVIKLRNEWLGHGVTRPDHEYASTIDNWDGPVMELLTYASVLSAWQFFVVKSTRLLPGERYRHTVVNIKGHNPKFLLEQLDLPVNCEVDKVYVWDAVEKTLLALDPFVSVFVCDQCNQETVFVYDKLGREGVVYLDYANGHHSTRIEPYRTVKRMLDPAGSE